MSRNGGRRLTPEQVDERFTNVVNVVGQMTKTLGRAPTTKEAAAALGFEPDNGDLHMYIMAGRNGGERSDQVLDAAWTLAGVFRPKWGGPQAGHRGGSPVFINGGAESFEFKSSGSVWDRLKAGAERMISDIDEAQREFPPNLIPEVLIKWESTAHQITGTL